MENAIFFSDTASISTSIQQYANTITSTLAHAVNAIQKKFISLH